MMVARRTPRPAYAVVNWYALSVMSSVSCFWSKASTQRGNLQSRGLPWSNESHSRFQPKHDCREIPQLAAMVATSGGPTTLARIGVMRALNRHVERVFEPSGKRHHRGRRKLARDR
jgi:hypothetical protein